MAPEEFRTIADNMVAIIATFTILVGFVNVVLGYLAFRAAVVHIKRGYWWAKYIPVSFLFSDLFEEDGDKARRKSLRYFVRFLVCWLIALGLLIGRETWLR